MATCNTVPLTDDLVLLWRTKSGWQYVEIDVDSIPWVNEADVCECLEDCEKIKALDAKDANLQSQINDLNNQTDKLREKDDDLQDQIDNIKEKDVSQDNVINNINTEISSLKTDYINVINKVKSLWIHTILDPTYTSFEDWVNNVYIPSCWTAENEFSEWDWYFNTNPAMDSSQGVYVNIRKPDSTEPCSINDWYKLPYDIPALAIIWIDPIFVRHPYRWRFEVGIDPDKLADFISKLDTLDLSTVKLYLWDVYLDWIIKESLTIEENLTVWDTIVTNDLTVNEHATINNLTVNEWHIDTHIGNEEFLWDINVEWDVNAINAHYDGNVQIDWNINIDGHTETNTIHAKEWCIEKFTCPVEFADDVVVWDTIINNENITVNEIHTHNVINEWDTHLEWPVNIISNSFNLIDPDTQETICLQNVVKNLSRPSYWFFTFYWWWTFSTPWYSTAVMWLGGNGIEYFNRKQNEQLPPLQQCAYVPFNTWDSHTDPSWASFTWTKVLWDEQNQTPWVWLVRPASWAWQIMIYWADPENAWVYRISFHMTVWFTDLSAQSPRDFYAHRAWICLYNLDDITDYVIFDDKHASGRDIWEYTHTHQYYDANDWEDASGSSTRTSHASTMKSYTTTWAKEEWYVDRQIVRSDDHYTYEVNIEVPISTNYYVAPYIKVSTWYSSLSAQWKFTITDWKWVTWWVSRLSIVKVANIGNVYEYHCEG